MHFGPRALKVTAEARSNRSPPGSGPLGPKYFGPKKKTAMASAASAQVPETDDLAGNGPAIYEELCSRKRAQKLWMSFGPEAPDTMYSWDLSFKKLEKKERKKKQGVAQALGTEIESGPYYDFIDDMWALVYIKDEKYVPVYNRYRLHHGEDDNDPNEWNLGVEFRAKRPGLEKNPQKLGCICQKIEVDATNKSIKFHPPMHRWIKALKLKATMYHEKLSHHMMCESIRARLGLPFREYSRPGGWIEPGAQQTKLGTLANTCVALNSNFNPRRSPRVKKNEGPSAATADSASGPALNIRRNVKKTLIFPSAASSPKGSKKSKKKKRRNRGPKSILRTNIQLPAKVWLEREVVLMRMAEAWKKIFLRDAVQSTMQVFNMLRGQGPGEDMFQNIVCACPRKELERITRVYHPLALANVRKALQNARNKEKAALSSDEQPAPGMVDKMMDLTGGLVDLTAEPVAAKKVPKKIKKKQPVGPVFDESHFGESSEEENTPVAEPEAESVVTTRSKTRAASLTRAQPVVTTRSKTRAASKTRAQPVVDDAGPMTIRLDMRVKGKPKIVSSSGPVTESVRTPTDQKLWIRSDRAESGYKGVMRCYRNAATPWRAKIGGNTLGRYASMAEACQAVYLYVKCDEELKPKKKKQKVDEDPMAIWEDDFEKHKGDFE